jgi:hypothetical protein
VAPRQPSPYRSEGRAFALHKRTLFSRRNASELCRNGAPGKQRAQGKPGADCTRGRAHKNARVDHRFNRIVPAFPARMVYGLLRALLGDRAFLPPSPSGLTIHLKPGRAGCISARLDASIGAPGPHDFAVRAHLTPKVLPGLVRSGEFWRRRLAAPFVRAPATAHGKTRPAIPLRARRCRVHRIPPRVRDDREPPLVRVRRAKL